jgi:hypothetical protein
MGATSGDDVFDTMTDVTLTMAAGAIRSALLRHMGR